MIERAEIYAICYQNGTRSYTKMDLTKTYYKHKIVFVPIDEYPWVTEYWIISLVKNNPEYSEPCWLIPSADSKYFRFFK